MADSRPSMRDLDKERDRLAAENPGWHIWYVPTTGPGGRLSVVWCAQPLPLLNCHSPEDLSQEIGMARGEMFAFYASAV